MPELVDDAAPLTLRAVARRFWPQVRPLRTLLLLALGLLMLAPLIEVLEVLLFKHLVDEVLVPVHWQPLIPIAATFVALNLASAVVSGSGDYLSTWISQRFLVGLRTQVFEHVLGLPLHVLERRRLGDVIARLGSDVSTVESFMIGNLTSGLSNLVQLGFFVGALFWLQPTLASASLVVAPVFWLVTTRFARYVKTVSRERRRRAGSLSAVAEESLANGPLVQVYGREADAVARYESENRAIADAELAGSRLRALFMPLVDLTELLGVLLVIALGTWALSSGRLSLGGLLAFLTLMAQCYRPLRSLSSLIPSLYSATAGVERIVELLDEPPPVDPPWAYDLAAAGGIDGAVGFDRVSARYPGATSDAIVDLSLYVRAGETVAVTGPSGAGKSTLVRLLLRDLGPTSGRVRIDDHDLRRVRRASIRDAVTVVLQETLLQDASVHDNIAFARPNAERVDVVAAARAAGVDDFIGRLADGYDTRIGQRGRQLSGGQRQRLAMARALLRDTPILVLDEPTTGLDPDTAEQMMRPLLAATSTRTVIVVTHDPVVLAMVDRVVRLSLPLAATSPTNGPARVEATR